MNKIKFILFIFIFLLNNQFLFSQNMFCATRFKLSDFIYAKNRTQIISSQIPQDSISSLPQINTSLSVAVHIVKDSLGETDIDDIQNIYDQIDITNNLFSPILLSFNICSIDSIDNFQYNNLEIDSNDIAKEEAQIVNLFNVDSVINIYLVKEIESYDWATGLSNKSYMIILKDNLYEIPHMMGHIFGLLHTCGDGNQTELVNKSNCEIAGDFICETNADPCPYPYIDNSVAFDDCELSFSNEDTYLKDANIQWYIPPSENYMSFFYNCRLYLTSFQYRIIVYEYFLHHNWLK